MAYDNINTLRFVMAHLMRTDYKQDPADYYQGLFSTDALRYWLSTGMTADQILLKSGLKPVERKFA